MVVLAVLEAFSERLGASWAELEMIWAPKRVQKRRQRGPKRRQKRHQRDINFLIDFLIAQGCALGFSRGGGGRQNGTKMYQIRQAIKLHLRPKAATEFTANSILCGT